MASISVAHIINPYRVEAGSDQFKAQAVTFATMKTAQAAALHEIDVTLFAAFFPEDEALVPAGFIKTQPLGRSVLDMAKFEGESLRKLPLLKDVLDGLYEKSAARFFIYTNADIALMPRFYSRVKSIIEEGFTGFAINRRTISDRFAGVGDIPQMIEAAEQSAEKHPGFDCFVFERKAYKKYVLGTACIGGNWIGRVLLGNVMAHSAKFAIFEDERVTFHIGDDRSWLDAANAPYNQHNEAQLTDLLDHFANLKKIRNKMEIDRVNAPFLEACQAQEKIPNNIIEMNSPVYDLSGPPEKIYQTRFVPSGSKSGWEPQLLRQDPVFIVGYPRSGTTPVQALIATQENIHSLYETHFFSSARVAIEERGGSIIPECLEAVIRKMRERIAFSKNAEEHVRNLAQRESLSSKMLFEILVIDNLIGKVGMAKLRHVRWMEKTPLHAQHLHMIHRFYPAAKVIHVVRHPEKAIVSRRRHFTFNNETEWLIEKHVQKWLECVIAVENFALSNPRSVLTVKLEDVARHPGAEMKTICRFLGIPFDRHRLEQHKDVSASLHYPWETWKRGSMNDISRATAERKNYSLSLPDREKLWTMAGEEMQRYGYRRPGMTWAQVASRSTAKAIAQAKENSRRLGDSLNLLIKASKGKINMADQMHHFYGQHRNGWRYAVQSLRGLHNRKGVRFDAFIERTFAWRPAELRPHLEPWIGFIHVPPNIPDWFQGYQSNEHIFKTEAWRQSAPFCKGLFTLSEYHRRNLQGKTEIKVNNLLFPTDFRVPKWSWEQFASNREKKIIQVGWWLRRIHSIFQLPEGNYRKIFLKINYFDWEDLIQKERDLLRQEEGFRYEMLFTADTVTFLPDREYDRMLSENIVFLHLYDSSANNTIIECIARHTPILVNPLEAVVEYLGQDYPFYFDSLAEAAQKAENFDLVRQAHQYLAGHPIQEKLTGEHFLKSFVESEIYRML